MPEERRHELELREYVQILRRRKWWIVVVTAASVAVAITVSALQTPVYEASAEVLLRTRVSERIFSPDGAAEPSSAAARVETEIEVMKSRSVLDAVTEELGFVPSVSISSRGDTEVIAIRARNTDPERASAVANTYAETYVASRRDALVSDLLAAVSRVQDQIAGIDQEVALLDAELAELDRQIAEAPGESVNALIEQRGALVAEQSAMRVALGSRRLSYSEQIGELQLASELTQTGGAQIVSAAEAPTAAVEPQPRRNAAVALVLGLLGGVALALLREHLDDSIKSKADLDAASGGSPLLALVPAFSEWRDRSQPVVASIRAPNSATAEAYRNLRTSLQFIGIERPTKLVQVTSSDSGDGKTTTLANLGVALANAGQRVLLVDCDLRRPRLHQFFGLDNTTGLSSAIIGEADLVKAVREVDSVPDLAVLSSGPPPPNPSELLSSKRVAGILTALAAEFDYVLIDSPPVLPVTDGLILSGLVDATAVIVSARSTTKGELRRCFELLGQVDAPVIGVVFNSVEAGEGYYGSPYGHRYSAAYGQAQPPRRLWGRPRRAMGTSAADTPTGT